jgi:hypothetical protein
MLFVACEKLNFDNFSKTKLKSSDMYPTLYSLPLLKNCVLRTARRVIVPLTLPKYLPVNNYLHIRRLFYLIIFPD